MQSSDINELARKNQEFRHGVKIVISVLEKEGRFYGESYSDGKLHQKICV